MRCFFAVKIPDNVKKEINTLLKKYPKIKFIDSKNLHFTLKFIGESKSAEELIKKAQQIRFDSFDLRLEGIGCFPDKNNIRVLWIGAGKGREKLENLAELVSKSTMSAGSAKENFTAHLTIARCRNNCDKKILFEDFKSSSFKVSKFYLIKSVLTAKGAVYTIVRDFNLI